MTDMSVLRAEAAKARAAASGQTRSALPCGEAKREDVKFDSKFRAELVEKDGQEFYLLEGYASMAEQPYEMWDMFGPYNEVVSRSAFDKTLAASPMVVFRFNHGGTAMATTANGRLELSADALGLKERAWINPKRADVRDLITAVEDKDVTEQSFMFMINDGVWNEDYTEFRINEVDLNRGDVGPVTYGANPYTLIASRAGEFLSAIPDMPVLAAREAMNRLAQRTDLTRVSRAVDPDEDPTALLLGVDGVLDQISALVAGVDTTGLPEEVQQALSLVVAAETTIDELLDLFGITDPDDMDTARASTSIFGRDHAATTLAKISAAAAVRPIVSPEPTGPGGSSIRLRLAQLEVDKQHD